jgi:hypothetical protein
MTERIVRPIRAWAEYDELSVYIQDYWSGTDNPTVDRQWFAMWGIPKTGSGYLATINGFPGIVAALNANDVRSGPLRSVRVLYENGYELKLQAYANINGLDPEKRHWHWYLVGVDAAGDFAEDRDSEAVERAMIAAAAWFTQANHEMGNP